MSQTTLSGTLGISNSQVMSGTGNDGALIDCSDVLCIHEGIFEPRPGLSSTTHSAKHYDTIFPGNLASEDIWHYLSSSRSASTTQTLYSGVNSRIEGSTEVASAAFLNIPGNTLCLTQLYGLCRVTGRAIDYASVPEGLDLSYAVTGGGSGFLANNEQCAYKVVFGLLDTSGRVYLGAPGGRLIVTNTGGSASNITLTGTVPSTAGFTFTANTSSGSPTLSTLSSFSGLYPGQRLSGTGIPTGTRVLSMNGTTLTMSANATATNTGVTVTAVRYFYQIHRTNPVPTSVLDPGSEMSLVYEDWFSSTDISGGTFTVIDYVPTNNGGAALYSNEFVDGPQQINLPCEALNVADGTVRPLLAQFSGCVFAASYKPKPTARINLLGVLTENGLNAKTITADTTDTNTTIADIKIGGVNSVAGLAVGQRIKGTGIPAGTTIVSINSGAFTAVISAAATATQADQTFVCGDVITVHGIEYYAYTSETTANREFLVSTSGTASVAVRDTALSFVRVFNRSSSTVDLYAEYTSGQGDYPGRVRFFARQNKRTATGTVFASGHPQAWYPNLTVPLSTTPPSDTSVIVYSKEDKPFAFPALNQVTIPNNATPTGFSVLRGVTMIWTTGGLYRLAGKYGYFRLEEVDKNYKSVGTNGSGGSIWKGSGSVVLSNVSYALTNQGLSAASESGVTVVSDEIKSAFVSPNAYNDNPAYGEVFVDEVRNLVLVGNRTHTWVYCPTTESWTRLARNYQTGYVTSAGLWVFMTRNSSTGDNVVYTQRSDTSELRNAFLYYDGSEAVTLGTINTTANTMVATGLTLGAVGDVVEQGAAYTTITAVDGTTITVDSVTGFANGAATVYLGYDVSLTYAPTAMPPSDTEHMRFIQVMFDPPAMSPLLTPNTSGRSFLVYGKATTDNAAVQTTSAKLVAPRGSAYTARFSSPPDASRYGAVSPGFLVRTCRNHWRATGMSLDLEKVSERTRR